MERMSAFSVCVIMDKSSPNLHEYIVSKLFDKCFVIPGSAGGGVHKTVPLPLKSPSFVTALPPRPPSLLAEYARATALNKVFKAKPAAYTLFKETEHVSI